jgi:drug/metabolite transporter (DMT)-like permease
MKRTLVADASLLFVAFIWGATFVIVQNAIEFIPPNLFNGIRFLIAAALLSLFLFNVPKGWLSKELLKSGVFLGLFLFIGYSFQTVGLMYTTSSKAGFITGLSVMVVPLLSVFILKEKPSFVVFIAAGVGTIGLYFLTFAGLSQMNIGDVLVLICAIGFALHIVYTGKFSNKHQALPLTIIQLLTVSILSFISAGLFERSSTLSSTFFNQDVLIALAVTSILATALAFLLQTKFQQITTAARVALIFAMEPVFAALTAFLLISERLTTNGLIGCFLIFLAMIVSELPNMKIFKTSIKQETSL